MKKKQIVVFLLCAILSFGLSACGNSTDKIEKELQGRWILKDVANLFDSIYEFEDGKITVYMSAFDKEEEVNAGTYEIGETVIEITYDTGKVAEINYSFEDDKLTLSIDEFGVLEKEGAENTENTNISTQPLVGEWKTKWIINDGEAMARDEIVNSGGKLYIDIIVDKDMNYVLTLGDDYETVSGVVSVTESEKGDVYTFLEAGMGGLINPENTNEFVLAGEEVAEGYSFVLEKVGLNESKSNNDSSSFTNKYGTADTKCVVSGCSNKIASSGDTNCCVSHSNNCLECGNYIDGDATYCMDCLSGAISGSSESSSSGSGCGYKYPDGSICGASLNNYDSLCDYHFEELNNTYNSYTN